VALGAAITEPLESMEGPLRTGYTYSGHPTCAAAAIKNIEIIEEEALVERASHIGATLGAGLEALAADGLIESCRGIGGIWAAELGRDALPAREALLDQHGVIVRPIGTALAMCPPLVITDDEMAAMLDALADVLTTA